VNQRDDDATSDAQAYMDHLEADAHTLGLVFDFMLYFVPLTFLNNILLS
jgi:hypothetical protein